MGQIWLSIGPDYSTKYRLEKFGYVLRKSRDHRPGLVDGIDLGFTVQGKNGFDVLMLQKPFTCRIETGGKNITCEDAEIIYCTGSASAQGSYFTTVEMSAKTVKFGSGVKLRMKQGDISWEE
jgi:hypothetical protein